jgi:hypothetical protein
MRPKAIDYDRAGISFGGKRAGFLVQGDNRPLFGHGGVAVAEILASVREEGSRFAHSQVRSPTPLKDRDTGLAVLVQHLRVAHFLLRDGTKEFEKAVARPGEVARVLRVRVHLARELDGRVLGPKVDKVAGKVGRVDLGGLNLDDRDVLRVLLQFGASTDDDFGRKDNVAESLTLVSGPLP